MEEHALLRRAALAVVRSVDHEASLYEAQSPVEDWALDALEAAVAGDLAKAASLLGRYEHAEWEERRSYAISEWDEACPAAARGERPLTEDGHLRYCDRCGYEPPESAMLPVTPPRFEDADGGDPRPATTTVAPASPPRGQ
jgi:hypothetical protein